MNRVRRYARPPRGFTMIELMVVVIIVGVLAAIAIPIYAKYARNARVTEVTGRMSDLLTAAKAWATEHDADGNPATVDWPPDCGIGPNGDSGFLGDCSASPNADYALAPAGNVLTITGTGHAKLAGVTVTMTVHSLYDNGTIVVAELAKYR